MGVAVGVFFLSIVGLTLGTSCSESNRTANLDQCLRDIHAAGLDPDAYWFGNDYSTICPQPLAKPECSNPDSSSNSIFTRLFPTGLSGDMPDRYLKMVFTSGPGNYDGCGNTYSVDDIWTQEIDPLGDVVVTPWYVRNLPHLEWRYDAGDLFTLVVYDVGYLIFHGVYVNINGDNIIGASEAIDTYHGPLISTSLKNPYIFLVFKQTGQLTVSQDWKDRLANNTMGDLSVFTDLIDQWSLTGPVAMNWVVATGDVYAAGRMMDFGVINMCADFVAKALNNTERPFLPSPASLDVSVDVTFEVTPTNFTLCCRHHKYEQESFELNPLGNPVYDTYKTSKTPTIDLMKKGLLYSAKIFGSDKYTLIMVDPDVPVDTVGTQSRPLLHWLVTNIRNGNISTGDEYKDYWGPAPPDRKAHYYYFLLYRQNTDLSLVSIMNYAGSCPERLLGRCLFNINGLVSEQGLTLVGASWMTATTDIYVAKGKLGDGPNTNEWCNGMPGYGGDPECRVGVASQTLSSCVLILFALLFILFS